MTDEPALHLIAGDGLLARRTTELLFLPAPAIGILEAFRSAALGEGLDAVTEFCESCDFEVDDFVALDWAAGVRVAVFGDVELTSNQKSLPRLSGTDAGTWVERSLRKIDAPLEIGVSVDDRIDATDLVAGVAQAGGFVLCLAELPAARVVPTRQSAFREPEAVPREAGQDSDSLPAVDPLPATEPPVTEGVPEPAHLREVEAEVVASPPAIVPSPAVPPPEPVVAVDVAESPGQASQVADDLLGGSRSTPIVPHPYAVAPGDDTIVPTPEMRSLVDSLVADGEATPAAQREETPRWQLRIVEGGVEVVDRDLILGRNPQLGTHDTADGVRLIPLDGTHLSRSHLRVTQRDGAVFLTDLGSKNGSFIVTTGDDQLVQLEADNERRVDAGTIVQTGSVRFFVESRGQ